MAFGFAIRPDVSKFNVGSRRRARACPTACLRCSINQDTPADPLLLSRYNSLQLSQIHRPTQPVFTLDHDVQNKSEKNLTKYANIEKFAKQNSIDFYPAGRGIGHQIMIEEGYAWPGTMVVASDSHSNM